MFVLFECVCLMFARMKSDEEASCTIPELKEAEKLQEKTYVAIKLWCEKKEAGDIFETFYWLTMSFLKRKSVGYRPKMCRVFSSLTNNWIDYRYRSLTIMPSTFFLPQIEATDSESLHKKVFCYTTE